MKPMVYDSEGRPWSTNEIRSVVQWCFSKETLVLSVLHKIRRNKRHRSHRKAQTLLNLAELILPRKITGECFGDLFEALEEMAQTVPGWRLQLEALISIGWAVLFTLKEIAKPGALIAAIWRLLFGPLF